MASPPATEETALLLAEKRTAAADNVNSNRRKRLLFAVGAVVLMVLLIVLVVVLFRHADLLLSNDIEYDAIVIGGGPAGTVISRFLAEDSWRRVLLIEAGNASQVALGGKDAIPGSANTQHLTPFDVPFYWTSVANTPSVHWDYPDVNIAKALGGCGIHNAMLYVRALPSDLERWAMKDWSWAKALQLYLRMEDFDGPNSSFHSTDGFVRTSPPAFKDELSTAFLNACEDVGLPRTVDFNAPGGRYGAGFYHFNTRDGVRESAAKTFLGPVLNDKEGKYKNFQLLLHTHVIKINLKDGNDDLTQVAKSVDVRFVDGSRDTIRLAKNGHVILTAGAINTPKVLMMSGIGPQKALEKLQIPVKKPLAGVGMNLQDHPVVGVTYQSLSPREADLELELQAYFQARSKRIKDPTSYGLMGSAGISAGAFLIPPGSTIPEIQLTFFPRKSEPHMTNSAQLNHTTEIVFTVALLAPEARNRIVLAVKNNTMEDDNFIPRVVSEVPDEEPEHLRGDDVWKLSWGINVVREIAAVLEKNGVIGAEISPGVAVNNTDDLNEWVYHSVFRNSHWVGSAAMAANEVDGVVDNRLRVFGVPNLRVADASVIPLIPNGNVHSSVLMVASHAAELIKQDEQHREP